jgi:iron-sulfur cluster assembly accessory protein
LELIMDNTTTVEQTEQITLTQAAAQAVSDLLSQRNLTDYSLRVFVQGGGCSGFQYGMALDNRVRPEDLVLEQHGLKVLVDEVSVQYLNGATIDYVNEAEGSGFKITNPNLVSSCSCGQSSSSSESEDGSCGCGGSCH